MSIFDEFLPFRSERGRSNPDIFLRKEQIDSFFCIIREEYQSKLSIELKNGKTIFGWINNSLLD